MTTATLRRRGADGSNLWRQCFDNNGYKPFLAPVPLIAKKRDVNIAIFCIQVVILAALLVAVT
jgi:hypothetical protein